jgi:hypothetical protein
MLLRMPMCGFAVFLSFLPLGASATVYKMECREWRGAPNSDYLGSYVFSFDSKSKSLSISYKPELKTMEVNALFGANVKTWTLIWEKDLSAVFYGIDDSGLDPVNLLILKFSIGKMFDYSLGGLSDDNHLTSLTRKECRRLN